MSRVVSRGMRCLGVLVTLALALQFSHSSTGYAAGINLNPNYGQIGTPINVTGGPFQNGEQVNIYFGTLLQTQTTATNNNGQIAATIHVPSGTAPGTYSVNAVGVTSHIAYNAPFTVQGAPATTNFTLNKSVAVNNGGFGTSATAQPGDTLTYQVMYTNTGAAAGQNIAITDHLAVGQSYVSSSPGCTPTVSGGVTTVTCQIGAVPVYPNSGYTGSVYIVTQVQNNFSGTIHNTASIAGTNYTSSSSNTTSVAVNVATGSVQFTKTVSVDNGQPGTNVPATFGSTLRYRVDFVNNTNATISTVTVSDSLQPGQSQLFNIQTSAGTCTQNGTGYTVSCTINTVPAGQRFEIAFSTTVNTRSATSIPNTAYATYSNVSNRPSNTTIVSLNVVPPPPTGNGGTLQLCGPVVYNGSNAVKVSGVVVTLAYGAVLNGSVLGGNECITFTINSAGQATSLSLSNNLAGVSVACGAYYPTGTASVGVGGITIPTAAGFGYWSYLQTGGVYCFLLTPGGQVYSVLSGIPTSAHVIGADRNRAIGF